jgi:hypothetical protein
MPYHHHYHHRTTYYRRAAVRVPYTCGVCGLNTTAVNQVPQCAGCLRPLCQNDNKFGFCPQHYDELIPEDKLKVQEYGKKIKKAARSNIWLAFLPLMIIPFSLYPIFTRDFGPNFLPRFLTMLIGSMVFVFFTIFYVAYGSRKKIMKIMEESKKLTEKYQFSVVQTKPNQIQNPLNPTSINEKIVICQSCGHENKDTNPRFCTVCGNDLI